MSGWQSCPTYKAFPFLKYNAAATICMVLYTLVIMLQMHEHPHTTFHPHTVENGVLIAKTKMSYHGMVGLGLLHSSLMHRI